MQNAFRRAVLTVALLNAAYFGIEFAVASAIGSVSLFADSVDFLEDASVNLLILVGLGWSALNRGRLGAALAAILLIPGIATIWTAVTKFMVPAAPSPLALSATGLGALAINLFCAFRLAKFRRDYGSLAKVAFLSARNDAIANVAIIAAGILTAITVSAWPDLLVGVGIAIMNIDAAREVFSAARKEVSDATE